MISFDLQMNLCQERVYFKLFVDKNRICIKYAILGLDSYFLGFFW